MTAAPPGSSPGDIYERELVPAFFGAWAADLVERAAATAGARVLDIACGTGVVTRLLPPRVGPAGRVVGLDLNANMLGAARELGWHGIARTGEGAADPVLAAVPDAFTSFQWHDDTFTLPPDAVRLATNPAAENQAFRIGRAAYGIQFHFEADRPLVSHWTRIFADYLAGNHPDWSHEEESARHGHTADAAGLALARAWVSTIPAGAARAKDAA